jgi:CRISPR-associated protein Cmr3
MSEKWQALILTPLDTLFFREPRPFTAGEGTDAWSRFPPTPMTVQGMVRSKLLSLHCGPWTEDWTKDHPQVEQVVGPPGDLPGSLKIRGPWLVKNNQWLLPAPLDLVRKTSSHEATALSPDLDSPSSSNLPGKLVPLKPPEGWTEFAGVSGWLTWEAYQEYLIEGRVMLEPEKNWWPSEKLWVEELRPGIGMDYSRNRVKEGMLYFARHVRLYENVSLGIEVSGLESLDSPWELPALASLGGEGRAVRLEKSPPPPWHCPPDSLRDKVTTSSRFKLVLTQPAWFRKGWYPDWLDLDSGSCSYNGLTAQWVAARIERPVKIGGWDMAAGRPKPLRAFVPAGSVFYFELQAQGDAGAVFGAFWNRCLSQNPTDNGQPLEAFDQIGFGHGLVGNW